jgi:hypothetical protein
MVNKTRNRMGRRFVVFLLSFLSMAAAAAPVWKLAPDGGILLNPAETELPYRDHIEMSGQRMSAVIRWGVEADGHFTEERSLVFPMLRTVPNNTHASLMHRIGTDIPSLLSVNGLSLKLEQVQEVEINGFIRVVSSFAIGKANIGLGTGTAPKLSVELTRSLFPSVDKPLFGETYTLVNVSDRAMTVYVPAYSQVFRTPAKNGVDGVYVVRADLTGTGTFVIEPGESVHFGACFQAYREAEKPQEPDLDAELARRAALVEGWDESLVRASPPAGTAWPSATSRPSAPTSTSMRNAPQRVYPSTLPTIPPALSRPTGQPKANPWKSNSDPI